MVTALTTSGGLYVWGMGSVGDQNQSRAIPDICGIPNYVEVDGDADIEDVAVGTSHAIVLTGDARLLVIGDNRNGQLGLGIDDAACAQSWTRLHFSSPYLYHPVGVAAGPRSSFVIMSDQNRRESLPQEK
jgi:alpha-tubulin suppressor-like RCC1 family protein